MLSHLYQLAASFRRMHGFNPNRLYLNHGHYRALRASLPELRTETDVACFLGMEILVTPGLEHPDVAWVADRLPAGA